MGSTCGSMDRASVYGTECRGSTLVEPQSDSKVEASVMCDRASLCFQMQAENTPSLGWDVKWRSRVKERHTLCTLKNPSHSIVKSKVETRCGGTPALTPSTRALGKAVLSTERATLHKTNKQTNKQTILLRS